MRRRALPRLAWGVWGVAIALSAASLVLRGALGPPITGPEGLAEALWWSLLIPALVPAYATVGAVVASRRPDNAVGWLCLALGTAVAAEDVAWQYGARAGEVGTLPGAVAAALAAAAIVPLITVHLTALLLLFPDGRFLSRRWGWVLAADATFAVAESLAALFAPSVALGLDGGVPNPIGLEVVGGISGPVSEVGTALGLAALFLALLSVFRRWRRAAGEERGQLKWLAYAGGLIGAALAVGAPAAAIAGPTYPVVLVLTLAIAGMTLGVPVAIGVAMLRHRLYDVDLLINRTLVYGALTGTLLLVYAAGVVASQAVVGAVAGDASQLAVVASTLAVAALFSPLRRRLQRLVDRRFYRAKYDARRVLEGYAARLRDETDLARLGGELLSVTGRTVQPEHASLWLRGGGR